MSRKQRTMLLRIIIAFCLTLALQFVGLEGWWRFGAFLAVYILIGYDILRKAALGVIHGRVFDENFLMVVATTGAFGLALYEESGDFNEAIAVMLLYQVGEFCQSHAVGKSRKSISALMDIRPDYANIESATRPGSLERVDPDEVEVGTIIIVQPGERVPIDGVVVDGHSSLNTAALTGESMPRDVSPGDDIISGSINLSGVLRVKTTSDFDESTVSKLLEMIEDSAASKSQSEAFISRFAKVYTPVVCYAALALAVLPPLCIWLFSHLDGTGISLSFSVFEPWVYRALTFLVISCPCALVVSIPMSFFAGIGGASRAGILFKGSNVIEALSKVRAVVFDKTGTLTEGQFKVNATHHPDFNEQQGHCSCHDCEEGHEHEADERILTYAAHAECASAHPISTSIRMAYGKEIDNSRVADIQEISGQGVTALVDNKRVAVGNEKLMAQVGARFVHCESHGTIVHVAIDGQYCGHIVISDVVKATSAKAVEQLRRSGVTHTVMLTGDSQAIASDVARQIGIDHVYAELMPADKVNRVNELSAQLKAQRPSSTLAFVGDGVNDAPVLAQSDIGIAMGALGSDAAIEAADVVLMDDDPRKIATAIRISRHTLSIVWQNIIFALGIKFVCLVLGAFGITNMWLAIFADVGVMLLAILNALRAMHVKKVK